MRRALLATLFGFCCIASSTTKALNLSNALVLSYDNEGSSEQNIIKGNTMYAVADGQVQLQVQTGGDCTMYVPEERVQITEPCDQLPNKISALTNNLRAQMGVTDEQMAMMRNLGGGGQKKPFQKTANRTVAGLNAECITDGEREYCVSKQLTDQVRKEGFDGRRFAAAFDTMRDKMGPMADKDPQLAKFQKLGFPVWDVKTGSGNPGIPGWEMIPATQRQQILAQMGKSAPGVGSSGSKLNSVSRENVTIVVPNYEPLTLEQFFQRMMQSAMGPGR